MDVKDSDAEVLVIQEEPAPKETPGPPLQNKRKRNGRIAMGCAVTTFLCMFVLISHFITDNDEYGLSITLTTAKENAPIPIFAGNLQSNIHQSEPLEYYRYYPLCEPYERNTNSYSLGEILRHERFSATSYSKITGLVNITSSELLCRFSFANKDQIQAFRYAIANYYRAIWKIQGRYAFSSIDSHITNATAHNLRFGFALGKNDSFYTHMEITLFYVVKEQVTLAQAHHFDENEDDEDVPLNMTDMEPLATFKEFYIVGVNVMPCKLEPIREKEIYDITYNVTWTQVLKNDTDNFPWKKLRERELHVAEVSSVGLVVAIVIISAILFSALAIMWHIIALDLEVIGSLRMTIHTKQSIPKTSRFHWFRTSKYALYPPIHCTTLMALILATGVQLVIIASTVAILATMGLLENNQQSELLQCVTYSFTLSSLIIPMFDAFILKKMRICESSDMKNQHIVSGFAILFYMVQSHLILIVSGLLLLPIDIALTAIHSSNALSFGAFIYFLMNYLVSLIVGTCIFLLCYATIDRLNSEKSSHNFWVDIKNQKNIELTVTKTVFYSRITLFSLLFSFLSFVFIAIPITYSMTSMWAAPYLGVTLSLFVWFFGSVVFGIVFVYFLLQAGAVHWWWYTLIHCGVSPALFLLFYFFVYYLFTPHIRGFLSAWIYFSNATLFCIFAAFMLGTIAISSAYGFFIFVQRRSAVKMT